MKVAFAVVCMECDEIYDPSERGFQGCPKCSSRAHFVLKTVLLPMNFYKDALKKKKETDNSQNTRTRSNKKSLDSTGG